MIMMMMMIIIIIRLPITAEGQNSLLPFGKAQQGQPIDHIWAPGSHEMLPAIKMC